MLWTSQTLAVQPKPVVGKLMGCKQPMQTPPSLQQPRALAYKAWCVGLVLARHSLCRGGGIGAEVARSMSCTQHWLDLRSIAIGSGRAWLGQAMFDVQGLERLIKLMVARGLALSAGKQSIGEPLAVVGQNFLYLDRSSLVQGAQKRASGSSRLVALDLNEHPARGTVNGYKQIAFAVLVGHLG